MIILLEIIFWKNVNRREIRNDQAIVEIELSDAEEEIRFPKMLKLIREVTEDPAYKNSALARI